VTAGVRGAMTWRRLELTLHDGHDGRDRRLIRRDALLDTFISSADKAPEPVGSTTTTTQSPQLTRAGGEAYRPLIDIASGVSSCPPCAAWTLPQPLQRQRHAFHCSCESQPVHSEWRLYRTETAVYAAVDLSRSLIPRPPIVFWALCDAVIGRSDHRQSAVVGACYHWRVEVYADHVICHTNFASSLWTARTGNNVRKPQQFV